MLRSLPVFLLLLLATVPAAAHELGDEGFVDSDGVKLHYVTSGKGPLVVLLHGFPDFWYTWRDQMPALAKTSRWWPSISAASIRVISPRESKTMP